MFFILKNPFCMALNFHSFNMIQCKNPAARLWISVQIQAWSPDYSGKDNSMINLRLTAVRTMLLFFPNQYST